MDKVEEANIDRGLGSLRAAKKILNSKVNKGLIFIFLIKLSFLFVIYRESLVKKPTGKYYK